VVSFLVNVSQKRLEKLLSLGFGNVRDLRILAPKRMSISEIANVLSVSKSFLYSLVKEHPTEVPKSREDIQAWADFIGRHRIEPIGGRMPSAPRTRG
jgi:hypothetical protein